MDENPTINGYVKWLETLGRTGGTRVAQFTTRDVRYRTPELDAMGRDGVAAVFASIFEGTTAVKTRVSDVSYGRDGHTAYLRWDRLVTPERGAKWTLSGITELTLNMDGKIISIIDYWNETPPDNRGFFSRLFNR